MIPIRRGGHDLMPTLPLAVEKHPGAMLCGVNTCCIKSPLKHFQELQLCVSASADQYSWQRIVAAQWLVFSENDVKNLSWDNYSGPLSHQLHELSRFFRFYA
jgi:hypothetical protein